MPMALTSDLIRISLSLRKIPRADGSLLSFLFIDVPDAKLYPDYYRIIKNPVCLKGITKKLRDAQYTTVTHITYDMDLLEANAKLYNGPGSFVGLDAEHIVSEYRRLVGALSIPERFLGPIDEGTLASYTTPAVDAGATADASADANEGEQGEGEQGEGEEAEAEEGEGEEYQGISLEDRLAAAADGDGDGEGEGEGELDQSMDQTGAETGAPAAGEAGTEAEAEAGEEGIALSGTSSGTPGGGEGEGDAPPPVKRLKLSLSLKAPGAAPAASGPAAIATDGAGAGTGAGTGAGAGAGAGVGAPMLLIRKRPREDE
jgi:hypothetical protein